MPLRGEEPTIDSNANFDKIQKTMIIAYKYGIEHEYSNLKISGVYCLGKIDNSGMVKLNYKLAIKYLKQDDLFLVIARPIQRKGFTIIGGGIMLIIDIKKGEVIDMSEIK